MLQLQAFGPVTLRGAEGLTQPKRLSLLIYLVLARPRGLQRRDTLLATFWPDMSPARGRKALSQSLFILRKVLPEGLLLTRGAGEVGLDHRRIVCDVIQFEEDLAERRWGRALDLYRGEFLAGFHLARAPGFEEWVALERDRLREMAAGAGWSEAMSWLEEGDSERAQEVARKALSLAPTREIPVRTFIRSLAEAGARTDALRFYEIFQGVLGQALDVDPAPETRALAQGLRRARQSGKKSVREVESEAESEKGTQPTARKAAPKRARAHALYRKGMEAFESGLPEDYARGLSRFEAALRLEPEYSMAHAGLALLLAAYPTLTYRVPPRYSRRLREAAERALELDPGSGHAWTARGYYLWTRERDWLGAHEALARALDLEPEDPHILILLAEYHRMLGRLEEGMACLDRLTKLEWDPSYAEVLRAGMELSLAEHGEMDGGRSIRRLESVLHREPADGLAHLWLAIALAQSDKQESALASVEASLGINPEIPLAHGFRGVVLARLGRRNEAMDEDAWFQAEKKGAPRDRFSWGLLRLALGDVDGGFGLMAEGVRRKPSFLLPGLRLMLAFKQYWDDPRFIGIMGDLWPSPHQKVLGPYGWQPDGRS